MTVAKNNRLSRDQKRKAKLKKRAERSRKEESLAYHGTKYMTAEYIPSLHRTEVGIHEAFVISDRALTDDDVEEALTGLIARMREGPLPLLSGKEEHTVDGDDDEALIVWCIRRHWQILAEQAQLPRRDDLIGILRTILHSLEIWRSKSLHSQGYLRYLEGFMKQTGVTFQEVTSHLVPLPAPAEDPLLELGRHWIASGDQAAAAQFAVKVERLLDEGFAERVIDVCQQLIGETGDLAVIPPLQAFALRGHRALSARKG